MWLRMCKVSSIVPSLSFLGSQPLRTLPSKMASSISFRLNLYGICIVSPVRSNAVLVSPQADRGTTANSAIRIIFCISSPFVLLSRIKGTWVEILFHAPQSNAPKPSSKSPARLYAKRYRPSPPPQASILLPQTKTAPKGSQVLHYDIHRSRYHICTSTTCESNLTPVRLESMVGQAAPRIHGAFFFPKPYGAGTLMIVFTIVIDAPVDNTRPCSVTGTTLPAVENVVPAGEMMVPTMVPPPPALMVAALPTCQ